MKIKPNPNVREQNDAADAKPVGATADDRTADKPEWRGYSFDELQCRRAKVAFQTVATETCLRQNYSKISADSLLVPRTVEGAINYLKYFEYAAIGWRTYRRVRAIVRKFRGK